MRLRRLDPFALAAAAICAVMTVAYVVLVRSQGETPAAWVVAVLVGAGAAAAYATRLGAASRRPVLVGAGALLLLLGVLAILSIGLPILLAGTLCLGAALRTPATARP